MPFLKLPPELQLMIFSHLTSQDGRRWDLATLRQLCLTCKAVRLLAEVYLYREIRMDFAPFKINDPRTDPDPPIHAYFHSIWTRPQLASYVKEVDLRDSEYPRDFESLRNIHPPAKLVQNWLAAVDELGVPSDSKYALGNAVRKGSAVALGGILFSRFTNLEKLTISKVFGYDLSQITKYRSSAFCNLKELHIHNQLDNGMPYWISNCSTWTWHLPRLEGASILLERGEDKLLPDSNISQHLPPSLRRLSLLDWGENQTILTRLFSSMPNIEDISYFRAVDTGILDDDDDDQELGYHNEWNSLVDILQPTTATLRRLTISVDGSEDMTYSPQWARDVFWRMGRTPIKPLTAFNSLRRLELPIFVLLGWYPNENLDENDEHPPLTTILPPALEELCIRRDLEDCIAVPWDDPNNGTAVAPEDLEQMGRFCLIQKPLASYISSLLHNLKILRLKVSWSSEPGDYALIGLAETCKRRGVELIKSVCRFRGPGKARTERRGLHQFYSYPIILDAMNNLVAPGPDDIVVTEEAMGSFYHDGFDDDKYAAHLFSVR